jgi:membrane fusion protein, heavy metal efflux system
MSLHFLRFCVSPDLTTLGITSKISRTRLGSPRKSTAAGVFTQHRIEQFCQSMVINTALIFGSLSMQMQFSSKPASPAGPQPAGYLLRGCSLVLALCLLGCHSGEKPNQTAEPKVNGDTISMPTNSPQLAALSIEPVITHQPTSMALAGRLLWDENATVRVFSPFAGIVRKLLVEVNQSVMKGAPLAEIQSSEFGQALAEARKAESDFRRTERSLNRVRELATHGAAASKDVEAAEADFASAQAEKERTEARLAIYGASVGSSEQSFLLPSPLAGVVVERNVNPGQEVRPDQMLANLAQFTAPLFVVTDPARLWIQIDATEIDLPYLRPGRKLTFTSRAFPGQTFTGRVDVVSEFIDPATRTIKVRGTVDNTERLLKAEMFVTVNLPQDQTSGVTVPSKAVFLKGEKHYVFVEHQPGEFSRHEVQLGTEQGGRIVVLAGVQPGERVVTDGCILLQQTLKE